MAGRKTFKYETAIAAGVLTVEQAEPFVTASDGYDKWAVKQTSDITDTDYGDEEFLRDV